MRNIAFTLFILFTSLLLTPAVCAAEVSNADTEVLRTLCSLLDCDKNDLVVRTALLTRDRDRVITGRVILGDLVHRIDSFLKIPAYKETAPIHRAKLLELRESIAAFGSHLNPDNH